MICVGGRALYRLARHFLQAEQSSSRQNLLEWLDECCMRFGDIVQRITRLHFGCFLIETYLGQRWSYY